MLGFHFLYINSLNGQLHWVFLAVYSLSLVLLCRLLCIGFSCCQAQALELELRSCGARALHHALQNVGSSQTRGRTRVPCIGRQIPKHWTTREVPISSKIDDSISVSIRPPCASLYSVVFVVLTCNHVYRYLQGCSGLGRSVASNSL